MIPIYTDVSEFENHMDSLKEIGEFDSIEEYKKDYPLLSEGENDINELIEYSKYMYGYISQAGLDWCLKNVYDNSKYTLVQSNKIDKEIYADVKAYIEGEK